VSSLSLDQYQVDSYYQNVLSASHFLDQPSAAAGDPSKLHGDFCELPQYLSRHIQTLDQDEDFLSYLHTLLAVVVCNIMTLRCIS
jgi:hypothetical protein